MNKPKVSVVLLTLNSEKYISRALLSVIKQNYSNIEIIIVDAGSTDSTKKIVSSLCKDIKWFDLPNSDMGMARNHGIKKASGKYIMFLDSDDMYMQNKISSQVKLLEDNNELNFVTAMGYVMKKDKEFFGIKKGTDESLTLNNFLNGACYCLGSLCIRNNLENDIIKFREGEEGRVCEDWSYQLSLMQTHSKYMHQQEPYIIVELRDDSHTNWSIQPKMKEVGIKILEETFLGLETDAAYRNNILNKNRLKLVISHLINQNKKAAKNILQDFSGSNFIYKQILSALIFLIPITVLSKLFTSYWLFRQKMSFSWHKISNEDRTWLKSCSQNMK